MYALDLLKGVTYSIACYGCELTKSSIAFGCSSLANRLFSGPTVHLATGALAIQPDENIYNIVHNCFQQLNDSQKGEVYGKVWELAKMQDPRVDGLNWGQEHIFDDLPRLAKALHRLGFLKMEPNPRTIPSLSFAFGEGGIGSQYFSLGEKLGKDPEKGQIGYVNGMGVPTLNQAGRDADRLSNSLLSGYNIHCVYNATHQGGTESYGFVKDIVRMKAVDGGSYTKTSYLIAQQWIDFLTSHPDQNFLQIAHSEGSSHADAALRLISETRSDLLAKIRILNFCPAHFINPTSYDGLQAKNFKKVEDSVIPWGAGSFSTGYNSAHTVVVLHTTGDTPHDCLSQDYTDAAKPYVDEFLRTGNIY